MIDTKTCKNCNKDLPVKAFHKKSDNADGLQSECKMCRSKKAGHKPNHRTKTVTKKQDEKPDIPEVTIEELRKEIERISLTYPHNRVYRKALIELREDNEEALSDETQNVLFRLWHKKVEATGITYILDETAPIITPDKERTINALETELKASENRLFYSDSDREE